MAEIQSNNRFGLNTDAQKLELTESGAYEKKEVVIVDSVKALTLFERAMVALSDWAGPDGKASAGIDYQEKETGTIIYKGKYSLGFKKVTFLGDGWERYADFSLKVRCKDGRAQVTVTIPTITGFFRPRSITRTYSIEELQNAVDKSKGAKHERGIKLMKDLIDITNDLISSMSDFLKNKNNSDDDF